MRLGNLVQRVTAPPVHDGTTDELPSLYPWVHEGALIPRGLIMGKDVYGGAFQFEPLEAARQGLVSSSNLVILGVIGRGKSSCIKAWLFRSAVFGWSCWILDPKGEYAPVSRALGYKPIVLRPHGLVRFNPLDRQLLRGVEPAVIASQQVQLLVALVQADLGRRLKPLEQAAIELALAVATREADENRAAGRRPREATLNMVAQHLLHPTENVGQHINANRVELLLAGRDPGLTLRRLCEGDLRGMFDGETSGVELDQPVVVIDLRAVYQSGSLGLIMTCLVAWLQRALEARKGRTPTTIILDEAWAILRNVHVARWVTEAIKLSREFSASYWLAFHKLSDTGAVGDAGSEQVALARALLEDIEMRIIYAQSPGEIERNGELLGLTATERAAIPQLVKGRGVWKIGQRSFLVQQQRTAQEVAITDTSSALNTRNTGAVADAKAWAGALADRPDAAGSGEAAQALAEARADGWAEQGTAAPAWTAEGGAAPPL